jgi:hypothetical protein
MSTAELPLAVQSDSLEDWCACAALGIKVVTQPDFKEIGGALSHHVQTKPYLLTMAHTGIGIDPVDSDEKIGIFISTMGYT